MICSAVLVAMLAAPSVGDPPAPKHSKRTKHAARVAPEVTAPEPAPAVPEVAAATPAPAPSLSPVEQPPPAPVEALAPSVLLLQRAQGQHSHAVGWACLTGGAAALAAGVGGLVYTQSVLDAFARQQPGGPDQAHPTVSRNQYNALGELYPLSLAAAVIGAGAAGVGIYLVAQPSGGAAGVSGTF